MSLSGVSGSWASAAQALLATLSAQSSTSSASTSTNSASTLSGPTSGAFPNAAFTPQASWPFASSSDSTSSLFSLQGGQGGFGGVGGFQGGPPPGPPPSFGGASDASTSTQSASTLSGVSTDTASSLASQLISALGDSKTGEISLSEFETGVASALGVSSSSGLTSSQTTAVTDAFNAIDANGDGELSQSELATAIQDLQQGGPPEGPPPSFGQGAPSATDVASGIMQSLTGSSSGTLSLSDVETAYAQSIGDSSASSLTSDQTSTLTSAFKAIDADGDGQISVAELATALQSYMPWLNDSSSGASSAASSTTSSTSITA